MGPKEPKGPKRFMGPKEPKEPKLTGPLQQISQGLLRATNETHDIPKRKQTSGQTILT